MCYERNVSFQHDQRMCSTHKADMEANKKAHGSQKHAAANVRKPKVQMSKEELSKLMTVGSELAKEIEEIKRS